MNQGTNYTDHCLKRCRQRGIPFQVVEFIINNGDSFRTHQHRKFFINKRRLNKLKHANKAFFIKYDKHLLNTAIVCNQSVDTVVTAMKTKGPIKWN